MLNVIDAIQNINSDFIVGVAVGAVGGMVFLRGIRAALGITAKPTAVRLEAAHTQKQPICIATSRKQSHPLIDEAITKAYGAILQKYDMTSITSMTSMNLVIVARQNAENIVFSLDHIPFDSITATVAIKKDITIIAEEGQLSTSLQIEEHGFTYGRFHELDALAMGSLCLIKETMRKLELEQAFEADFETTLKTVLDYTES